MCRAASEGGRRCKNPAHMSAGERAEVNKVRREKYAAKVERKKRQTVLTDELQEAGISVVPPAEMVTTYWYTTERTQFDKSHTSTADVLYTKPGDAVWTSPQVGDTPGVTAWTQFLEEWHGGGTVKGYLMEVRPDKESVIVEIRDGESLQRLYDKYPGRTEVGGVFTQHHLDFTAMKEDGIDGIHCSAYPSALSIIPQGSTEEERERILDGWDLESTAWLRKDGILTGKRIEAQNELPEEEDPPWGRDLFVDE